MLNVVVIGARRARQGIGEFVTRWLHDAGASIAGIVGTEPETISETQENLASRYGIRCRGYVCLDVALETERPDVVAICSPIRFHREQLLKCAEAGVHCLCEKPLWWGDAEDRRAETEAIVDAFRGNDRILQTITQWPFTLPAFDEVWPGVRAEPLETFEMRLSPITRGPRMLVDSVSHPISLLQGLVGVGFVEGAEARYIEGERGDLEIEFDYRHARGLARATCRFKTCAEPPRPASYAINGRKVEREIDLPAYEIYFSGNGKRVPVEDPVKCLVGDFLGRVERNQAPDRRELIESIVNLEALHVAGSAASTKPAAPAEADPAPKSSP